MRPPETGGLRTLVQILSRFCYLMSRLTDTRTILFVPTPRPLWVARLPSWSSWPRTHFGSWSSWRGEVFPLIFQISISRISRGTLENYIITKFKCFFSRMEERLETLHGAIQAGLHNLERDNSTRAIKRTLVVLVSTRSTLSPSMQLNLVPDSHY